MAWGGTMVLKLSINNMTRRRNSSARWWSSTGLTVVLLAPAFIFAVLLFVYPMIYVLSLSFRQVGLIGSFDVSSAPLTLNNYAEVFRTSSFGKILRTTGLFVAVTTLVPLIGGVASALLLNQKMRGTRFVRVLVLIPWVVPGVAAGAIFLWLLDPNYGILNLLLQRMGLIDSYVAWYSNPSTALFAVMIPMIWTQLPFFTIVALAALQGVPAELQDAARIDGARPTSRFFNVTMAFIAQPLLVSTVLAALTSFREFDIIYSLTGGGPVRATETLAVRIYNEFFVYFHGGVGAAFSMVTFSICVLMVIVLYPLVRRSKLSI